MTGPATTTGASNHNGQPTPARAAKALDRPARLPLPALQPGESRRQWQRLRRALEAALQARGVVLDIAAAVPVAECVALLLAASRCDQELSRTDLDARLRLDLQEQAAALRLRVDRVLTDRLGLEPERAPRRPAAWGPAEIDREAFLRP